MADLIAELDMPAGYDVVGILTPESPAGELADAGATWAIDGPDGPDEPYDEIRKRIRSGPPAGR
jgi:hypothetical protein